jgi:hypothetical protein
MNPGDKLNRGKESMTSKALDGRPALVIIDMVKDNFQESR